MTEAEASFLDSKRAIISTSAKIPLWFLLVTILLGWNEFVTVITTPTYLILLLLMGGGFYVVSVLHLGGPVEAMIKGAAAQALGMGRDYLARQLHAPNGQISTNTTVLAIPPESPAPVATSSGLRNRDKGGAGQEN